MELSAHKYLTDLITLCFLENRAEAGEGRELSPKLMQVEKIPGGALSGKNIVGGAVGAFLLVNIIFPGNIRRSMGLRLGVI